MEITKKDFDEAIKLPWSTKTCIIAQACIRSGIALTDNGEISNAVYNAILTDATAKKLMRDFDRLFINRKLISDGKEVREMLPIQLSV